jgi:hypothetical protein
MLNEEELARRNQPMTREEMANWFQQRGVEDELWLEQLLTENEGKTEAEMDEQYRELVHPQDVSSSL